MPETEAAATMPAEAAATVAAVNAVTAALTLIVFFSRSTNTAQLATKLHQKAPETSELFEIKTIETLSNFWGYIQRHHGSKH